VHILTRSSPKDEDAQYENTTWCNRDLIPTPPDRRTYGVWSYFGANLCPSALLKDQLNDLFFLGYWTVSGSCISAWSTGSTLLAFGLSPQQAIAVVVSALISSGNNSSDFVKFQVVGGILAGLLAVACGWMGENHHIGFTVSSRFSWGMRGSYCSYREA
jgi:NCS1 family nucleobase:cation symporter-1